MGLYKIFYFKYLHNKSVKILECATLFNTFALFREGPIILDFLISLAMILKIFSIVGGGAVCIKFLQLI